MKPVMIQEFEMFLMSTSQTYDFDSQVSTSLVQPQELLYGQSMLDFLLYDYKKIKKQLE